MAVPRAFLLPTLGMSWFWKNQVLWEELVRKLPSPSAAGKLSCSSCTWLRAQSKFPGFPLSLEHLFFISFYYVEIVLHKAGSDFSIFWLVPEPRFKEQSRWPWPPHPRQPVQWFVLSDHRIFPHLHLTPFSSSFSFHTNELPSRKQHPLLPWVTEMDFSRSRLWTAQSEGNLAIRCFSLSQAGGCFSLSQQKIHEWYWIRSTSDN